MCPHLVNLFWGLVFTSNGLKGGVRAKKWFASARERDCCGVVVVVVVVVVVGVVGVVVVVVVGSCWSLVLFFCRVILCCLSLFVGTSRCMSCRPTSRT